MKKIFATIATVLVSLSMAAQGSVVYYTPINETMEVGFGFNRQSNKCVFSIIEESKKDVNFTFDLLDNNGKSVMETELEEGNINILPKTKKVSYYECNYELSPSELHQLMSTARNSETVVINGREFDSNIILASIKNISNEMMKPTENNNLKMRIPHQFRPMEFRG